MQQMLRLNLGSKPRKERVVCEFCRATFKRPEYLTRHKRSHTLERPFQCPTCTSNFARKDLLLRHQRICRGRHAKIRTTQKEFITHDLSHPPTEISPGESQSSDSVTNVEGSTGDSGIPGLSFICDIDGADTSQIPLDSYENIAIPETDTAVSQNTSSLTFPSYHVLPNANLKEDPQIFSERRIYTTDTMGTLRMSSSRSGVPDLRDENNFLESSENPRDTCSLLSTNFHSSDTFLPRSTRCFGEFDSQIQERVFIILSNSCSADMKNDIRCLQKYPLRKYLEAFSVSLHRHMPIIHNDSFKLDPLLNYSSLCDSTSENTQMLFQVTLLLSMCAIGALHCLEKDKAKVLRNCAQKMIKNYESLINPCELKDDSLTFLQAKFFCWYYDIWSGDLRYFAHAIQEEPFFVQCCSIGSASRRGRSIEHWKDWICNESFHRLLWAIYIVLSDMGIAYNRHVPIMMADVCLPFPECDSLWNATTEEEWKYKIIETPQPPTFKDVMAFVLFGANSACHEMPDKSDFFIYVVSHCVINHIQGVITVFQWADSGLHSREIGDLRNHAWSQMGRIIDRFTSTYISGRPKLDSSPFAPSPHLFNASSVRHASLCCHYRVHGPLKNILVAPQFDLRLNGAISSFLDSPFQRGPLTNRAVDTAMDILHNLTNTGSLSMRWFASSYCSLEHALCAWNGILVLAHWLHRMEIIDDPQSVNEQELEILTKTLDVLRRANVPLEDGIDNRGIFNTVSSLAGAMIDLWGSVFGDFQVWEVTSGMALVLRLLSAECRQRKIRYLSVRQASL